MNFLAHLYLAEPTEESLVGNFLGDFVKGTPQSLVDQFPEGVIRGIVQHRAIDVFTDAHPTFASARAILAPSRRRFAGIIVDIFYDHFLSISWPAEGPNRIAFISHCYDILSTRTDLIPNDIQPVIARMIDQDWLGCYANIDGISLTLRRIATRSPKVAPIVTGTDDLTKHWNEFTSLFETFFPDLIRFSDDKDWL